MAILRLVLAACLLVTLGAPLAGAQSVTTVPQGDPLSGRPIEALPLSIAFFDVNGNGKLDVAEPDEPVYLHLGSAQTVRYGDVRLARWTSYAAGLAVAMTNADLGQPLDGGIRWLARAGDGSWYADIDNSRTISAGDIELGSSGGSKVETLHAKSGEALSQIQTGVAADIRGGYVDMDQDQWPDPGEPIIINLVRTGRVEPGDIRIVAVGYGTDDGMAPGAPGAHAHADIAGSVDDLEEQVEGLEERVDLLLDRVSELERDSGDDESAMAPGTSDSGLIGGTAMLAVLAAAAIAVQLARERRA